VRTVRVPFLFLARSGRAPRMAKGENGSLGFFYLEVSCGVMDRCFNLGRYGRELQLHAVDVVLH